MIRTELKYKQFDFNIKLLTDNMFTAVRYTYKRTNYIDELMLLSCDQTEEMDHKMLSTVLKHRTDYHL